MADSAAQLPSCHLAASPPRGPPITTHVAGAAAAGSGAGLPLGTMGMATGAAAGACREGYVGGAMIASDGDLGN